MTETNQHERTEDNNFESLVHDMYFGTAALPKKESRKRREALKNSIQQRTGNQFKRREAF